MANIPLSVLDLRTCRSGDGIEAHAIPGAGADVHVWILGRSSGQSAQVALSADVVVAPDEVTARELAAGYGLWLRGIRSGEGAIAFPTPKEARAHFWTDADRALVADRVDTQFTGSPRRKEANRAHAKLRAPGERANAQLKAWRILRKLRCCPWRAGQLAKAIHVLQIREA